MDSSQLRQLKEPFSLRFISWRAGKVDEAAGLAEALPYIDARAVQIRLDDVLGPTNWSVRFTEVVAGNRLLAVRCTLALRVEGAWVEKEDAAPVTSRDDSSAEFALKGAYSDALKRAAVQWGIGRYLYDYHRQWYPIDKRRNFVKVPVLPDELVLPEERAMQGQQAEAAASVPPAATAPVADEAKPRVEQPAHDVNARHEAMADAVIQKASRMPEAKAPSEPEPTTEAKAQGSAAPAPQPPAAAQTSAPAPAPEAAGSAPDYPQGLNEAQDAFVKDVLARIGKVKSHVLRSYVTGPKGVEKLTAEARAYILAKLEESEATA